MAKKPQVPLTDEQLLEVELQNEAELGRLQRQQRLLERDRTGYSSGPKFVRQKHLLGILEQEHNNIQTDLFVATSSTKKIEDTVVNLDLQGLIAENDNFEDLIKQKRSHLKEINEQIDMVKKKVIELRSKTTTDVQHQDRVLTGQKSVAGLENKLETITKQFCAISTENRKVRDEIDHLLLERVNFNKLWGNLIDKLNKGKAFMVDLIEQASVAYNQRDEWCAKLQLLRTRGHSDLLLHTEEMQQLQRKIDNDCKLEDFFVIKGRRRVLKSLEKKELEKRRLHREKMENMLLSHKQILAQVLEFTDAMNIDAVETSYYKAESDNFAVLNYINDIYAEIDGLTQTVMDIHSDIEVEKEIHQLREQRQKDNIAHLKGKLKHATTEATNALANINKGKQTLGLWYDGINKLCGIAKCSYEYNTFYELLGENVQLNDFNVLLYLGLLEKTVSRLILDIYLKEKQPPRRVAAGRVVEVPIINESVIASPIYKIEAIVPLNPCPLCVEQELVTDVVDSLQYVQSRDEVVAKLEQRLKLPDAQTKLHDVSACNLPKSRKIIQRRYQ